jgi:hypothetical protein
MILRSVSLLRVHDSERWPTIANNLILQSVYHCLQLQSLETSERSTNSKIHLNSGSHGIGLIFVKFDRLQSCLTNMPVKVLAP